MHHVACEKYVPDMTSAKRSTNNHIQSEQDERTAREAKFALQNAVESLVVLACIGTVDWEWN
jgi:hypothetical protein